MQRASPRMRSINKSLSPRHSHVENWTGKCELRSDVEIWTRNTSMVFACHQPTSMRAARPLHRESSKETIYQCKQRASPRIDIKSCVTRAKRVAMGQQELRTSLKNRNPVRSTSIPTKWQRCHDKNAGLAQNEITMQRALPRMDLKKKAHVALQGWRSRQ